MEHGEQPNAILPSFWLGFSCTKNEQLSKEMLAVMLRCTANGVRKMLTARGVTSVAAEGFGAPGVVVSYTDDPEIQSGRKFAAEGMQIAAGVPLQVGEPEGFRTFRLGLFGLDKLYDVDGALGRLERVLDRVL